MGVLAKVLGAAVGAVAQRIVDGLRAWWRDNRLIELGARRQEAASAKAQVAAVERAHLLADIAVGGGDWVERVRGQYARSDGGETVLRDLPADPPRADP